METNTCHTIILHGIIRTNEQMSIAFIQLFHQIQLKKKILYRGNTLMLKMVDWYDNSHIRKGWYTHHCNYLDVK